MNRIERAAEALNDVYSGAPPVAPVRHLFRDQDPEAAYAIQEVNTERWLADGRTLTGRKIGLTSKAVQAQLGVDQPDYGMLFDTMQVEDSEQIGFSEVCQARIEGEVAFVIERELRTSSPDMPELVDAIAYAVAAFEIVGSRIRDWDISLFDTIADNASSGMYVLGAKKAALSGLDLVTCRMILEQDGVAVSEGDGAACLGNPLNAALWLARKMAETGRPLQAGDTIMSGALGPFVTVKPGSLYELHISGLGSVRTAFGRS